MLIFWQIQLVARSIDLMPDLSHLQVTFKKAVLFCNVITQLTVFKSLKNDFHPARQGGDRIIVEWYVM